MPEHKVFGFLEKLRGTGCGFFFLRFRCFCGFSLDGRVFARVVCYVRYVGRSLLRMGDFEGAIEWCAMEIFEFPPGGWGGGRGGGVTCRLRGEKTEI